MQNTEKIFVKGIFFLLLFFSIVLGCTVLKIMDSFFKPVTLAILLSFVFYPGIRTLNSKFKIPWFFSTFIIFLAIFTLIYLIANILSVSFKSIMIAMPGYQERLENIKNIIRMKLEHNSTSPLISLLNFNKDTTLFDNINSQFDIFGFIKTITLEFTGSVVTFIKTSFLVLLISIFFLSEIRMFKNKLNSSFLPEKSAKIMNIVKNIVNDITHYVSIKFIMSLLTGILVFLTAVIFGLDFPLVWAFLSFILNFIPTFGSIISCGFTILFSLIQFYPSIWTVILIGIILILINVAIGNVVEPKIEGKNLGISPLIILLSLIFWGWIWGTMGLILAVPIMVIIKIIFENISFMKIFATLIGSKR